MKKLIVPTLSLLFLITASARADIASMAGTWSGTGAVVSLAGDPQGEYTVLLANTLQADGSIASKVTVTVPGSPDKQFDQVIRPTAHGFSIQSPLGSGASTCVGEGLCEGYFGDEAGNGTAMTIVRDDADHFRILKTELRSFHAIRLFREKYVRTSAR